MGLAKAAKDFLEANLRYSCGLPVECVIADTTIGGVKEAADCAEKFARENVGVSISVTPCWCYGSETMDMDPLTPKAVWGFNGTERPGAVYLAAVLAAHAQKGLPAFGIYGHDVQDIDDDGPSPTTCKEKLLRFAKRRPGRGGRCAASPTWRWAPSPWASPVPSSNPDLFEKYLGMRYESVDMSEIIRRMERGHLRPRRVRAAP